MGGEDAAALNICYFLIFNYKKIRAVAIICHLFQEVIKEVKENFSFKPLKVGYLKKLFKLNLNSF